MDICWNRQFTDAAFEKVLIHLVGLECLWMVSCKKVSKAMKESVVKKLPRLHKLYIGDKNEAVVKKSEINTFEF